MPLETNLQTQKNLDYRRSQRLSIRSGGIIGNWGNSGINNTAQVGFSVLYAVPLYLPDTCRVSAIFCMVVTTGAVASGNARMSLYTDSAGYPGTKLVTETEVVVTTTGIKRQLIGLTLPCGFYWGAITFSTASIAQATMQNEQNGAGQVMNSWFGGDSATDITDHAGINVAFTYDVLPTTFTAGAVYGSTIQPRILMQIGKYGMLD